jgi:hypothetical protein
MHYFITSVTFDFDELDPPSPDEQQDLIDDTIGTVWEADDGDDLVDEISTATGWCIKAIDYRHVLQS